MTMLASQITSLTVVYSIVYSGVDQSKHQSYASLAFVQEIHRGPVNFPHKWPVTRKMFPFDDVIMMYALMIWVSIGSGNGLSFVRYQAINGTNIDFLKIKQFALKFRDIFKQDTIIFITILHVILLKISSVKFVLFCLGLNISKCHSTLQEWMSNVNSSPKVQPNCNCFYFFSHVILHIFHR